MKRLDWAQANIVSFPDPPPKWKGGSGESSYILPLWASCFYAKPLKCLAGLQCKFESVLRRSVKM